MRQVRKWRGRKFVFHRWAGQYFMSAVWLTRDQVAEMYPPLENYVHGELIRFAAG